MASSLDGLLRLLPVFLDHIFRPTLEATIVQREVFHRDQAGTGRGVVYCEMGGREWSEQDQMDLALRRAVFGASSDVELRVYGWECGGSTKCLTTLQRTEIEQYHRAFYRPENVVVVVIGGKSLAGSGTEKLVEIIEATQFHKDNGPSEFIIEPGKIDFDVCQRATLQFPANDESLGSVGFGWTGPNNDDLYTVMALHVVMRMLKDTSASPLYQHFVERADPVASDIDYEIKATYRTMIVLVFSGVATHSEKTSYLVAGKLWSEMKECILAWRKDVDAVKGRLEVSLKSILLKLGESLEDEPHDICASYCAAEIVRSHWPFASNPSSYGESLTRLPSILAQLGTEPLQFWTSLMDQYLLVPEPAQVMMHPSREFNLAIKHLEEEQLKPIPCVDLPKDVHDDSRKVPSFEHTLPILPAVHVSQTRSEGTLIQHVQVDGTSVKRLTVLVDLSGLPRELWPCLVLLQELFFQADLEIGPEHVNSTFSVTGSIPYQELIVELSTHYSTYEASIGFDNEVFTTGYLDSHLIFSLHGRCETTRDQMVDTVKTVLRCTEITPDRVGEIVENLTSQLKDSWSEASTVLDSRLIDMLHQLHAKSENIKRPKLDLNSVPWIEKYMGLVEQTRFLSRASELLETNPDELIALLLKTKQLLCQCPLLINYGSGKEEDVVLGGASSGRFWDQPYHLPKNGALEGCEVGDAYQIELIPMSDLTASYLTATVPLNVLPRRDNPSEYTDDEIDQMLCLAALCQLFSYTEGPLYRRIRGAGLAYGASISMSLWHGLFSFNLNDSTDPATALQLFTSLVHDLIEEAKTILDPSKSCECITLTIENLNTAKAAQLFQFVSERSTPAALVSMAVRTALRGLPPIGSDLETVWNARLLQLELTDLARCVLEVVPKLVDPTKVIRLLAVPSSKLDTIQSELKAFGYKTCINNFVEESVDLLN